MEMTLKAPQAARQNLVQRLERYLETAQNEESDWAVGDGAALPGHRPSRDRQLSNWRGRDASGRAGGVLPLRKGACQRR